MKKFWLFSIILLCQGYFFSPLIKLKIKIIKLNFNNGLNQPIQNQILHNQTQTTILIKNRDMILNKFLNLPKNFKICSSNNLKLIRAFSSTN